MGIVHANLGSGSVVVIGKELRVFVRQDPASDHLIQLQYFQPGMKVTLGGIYHLYHRGEKVRVAQVAKPEMSRVVYVIIKEIE
ncbi:MAG: hypothetical protein AAB726_00010 [Patescibacteria group bacterium]